jgi:hypothetical protein
VIHREMATSLPSENRGRLGLKRFDQLQKRSGPAAGTAARLADLTRPRRLLRRGPSVTLVRHGIT